MKLTDEQLEIIYSVFAQGGSRIEASFKAGIKLGEFNTVYNSDKELQLLIENATNEYYYNSKKEALLAKPKHDISKDALIQILMEKLYEPTSTVKDVKLAWDLLYPEDDIQRHKVNMEIEHSKHKIELEKEKLKAMQDYVQSVDDPMIDMIESSIKKEGDS